MKQNAFLNLKTFLIYEMLNFLQRCAVFLIAVLSIGSAISAHAGGGGENMLLIVNPNDEPSLRIANAYVQARHIPINNIVYLASPSILGFPMFALASGLFTGTYQTAVPAAIAARGLTNQIDYIGTLGQPFICNDCHSCFQDCLNLLTQFQNGLAFTSGSINGRSSELFYEQSLPKPIASGFSSVPFAFSYVHGTNPAIHHSTKYSLLPSSIIGTTQTDGTATYAQWYMSGMIGYAGSLGLTTTQVIQNLQRTVAADGTKPTGTIYFEDSNDVLRTGSRFPYWAGFQAYMTANNIPWIQEALQSGTVTIAVNRKDVMGSEIGAADYPLPSGSIYLPGSWADALTSNGATYTNVGGQTRGNMALLSGAGGSSGSVTEPGGSYTPPLQNRFPMMSLNIYSIDGSTLGEAFYKSVFVPDLIQFQGDLLSQAYADIPTVAFTSGPANGATVSGTISLSGTAFLPNLTSQSTATGIANGKLFVDGKDTGASFTGAFGTFSLDTTQVTDGMHEVRLIAYNNSAANSEGCAISNYWVNNLGQSVSVTSGSIYGVAASGTLSIPVSASQGSGPTITGIQLQSLGRVVGSISGLNGSIGLSGTSLAYGNNTITPVAILSNGQQVQGQSITVGRSFQPLAGKPSTPLAQQNSGFDIYYYTGAAATTIAATNFSGKPNYIVHSNTLQIQPASTNQAVLNIPSIYCTSSGGSNAGLAVMVKASFTVITPGEYSFSFPTDPSSELACYWTSMNLSIDGVTVSNYDGWNGGGLTLFTEAVDTLKSVYLMRGEHTLTVKLANSPSGGTSVADANMNFCLIFRGVDSNVRSSAGSVVGTSDGNTSNYACGPYFYTVKQNVGH